MFVFSSILVYFFSIIIAISAMTFIVLLTISDEVSKRRQFFYLLCFCASNFLIETLYLCMTIQDSLLHYYHYNIFLRVFDTALYTLQSYSWCRYLIYFPSKNASSDKRSSMLCNIFGIVSLLLGIFTYAFLIDNQFLFTSDLGAVCDLAISLLLSIMLIYTAATRRRSDLHFNRFNLLITFMLILIQWWTSIFMIFETHTALPFEIHEYLTGAAQQMFVILALAVYVYKTDYSGVTLRSQLRSLIHNSGFAASEADTAPEPSVKDEASYAPAASADTEPSAETDIVTSACSDSQDHDDSPYKDINQRDRTAPASDCGDIPDNAPPLQASDISTSAAESVSGSQDFEAPAADSTAASGSDIPNLNELIARDAASADVSGSNTYVSDISACMYHSTNRKTLHAHDQLHTAHYDDSLSDIERIFDEKQLTKREREVARLAYAGLTNPEIADKLCISQHTVKRHMHSIFEKLNISARIELVHLMNRM